MEPAVTNTGISLVGDMPWGTHFCLFYETRRDFLETLAAYFRTGLERNEFCLWTLTAGDLTMNEARNWLRQTIPDADEQVAAGRIEIMSHEDWFLSCGHFEIPRVMDVLRDRNAKALAKGLSGLRLNGGPAWIQKRSKKEFEAFEHALDDTIAGQRIVIVCSFPLDGSSAGEMLGAAHTTSSRLRFRRAPPKSSRRSMRLRSTFSPRGSARCSRGWHGASRLGRSAKSWV